MSDLLAEQAAYLEACAHRRSLAPNTVRAYRQDLTDFLQHRGAHVSPQQVTGEDIFLYAEDLLRVRCLQHATAKRRLACLRTFFKWLTLTGAISHSPFDGIELTVRLPRRLPQVVSRSELQTISQATKSRIRNGQNGHQDGRLQAVPAVTDLGLTTYLAILLMAMTGVRVGELVGITLADIAISECQVRIHGKGSRERVVFLSNGAFVQLLNVYLKARLDNAPLTAPLLLNSRGRPLTDQALRLRLRRLAIQAGIRRRITPHMLRHTAATLLIEEGVDIRIVQRLLGHQSISTTEIYTHIADETLRRTLSETDPVGKLGI